MYRSSYDYIEADRAREIVRDAYKSEAWKKKVDGMSDRQVYAIFFSMCERNEKNRKAQVKAMSDNIKTLRENNPALLHEEENIPKAFVRKIKISCGESTPFMLSELERMRNGGFRSIKEVQEERRLNNNGYYSK